jgi:hypothetical protein
LTTCQLAPFTHGQPASAPENAIQRIERVHSGAPDGSPATTLPDIARQRDWGEIKACASVLDAWIATLQLQLTSLPDAPNGAPTHTRGFVMADDFCEAIHPDATAPHLQVTDVLDRALHRFVAPVGPEVGHA